METETLSNYVQKHLDNTMDIDIPQEDESVSPVNKTYEEDTESTDVQNKAETKDTENDLVKPIIEIDSEEECEEEEEEKLLLSPAHSDKAYDSDDDPLSPPLNRDLEESDNEGDIEEITEVNEEDTEEKSENLQNNLDDNKNSEDKNNKNRTKSSNRDKCEENTIENEPVVENKEVKVKESENLDENIQLADKDIQPVDKNIEPVDKNIEPVDKNIEPVDKNIQPVDKNIQPINKNIQSIDKNSEDKNPLHSENVDRKQDMDEDIIEISNDKVSTEDKQLNSTADTHENEDNCGIDQNDHSVLQESLNKPFDDGKELEADEEMDMDEDFDPSLLCPELSMEVDEAPVITTNDAPAPETDGSKSPLRLYDPIFSTFVDEMTGAEVDFNLTAEELELKAKTYGPKNPIQFTKIHCTACNVHLGSALDGQGNRFVHPLLKVLICKKCYHFYTSGEFEKDEDGSELYCRWCGQGGQVMCCSNCEMVFCKKCIRINFDRKKLSDIQKSDDWMCFRCNPSQLIHLRIHCAEFMEYIQAEIRRASSSGNIDDFMNTDYCQCCIPQKKKTPDAANPSQNKKRKRYAGDEDPDYDPFREREEHPPTVTTPSTSQQVITPKTPIFGPRVTPTQVRPNLMRPGLTSQNRPRVSMLTPPAVRNQQGFVKIMQGGVRLPGPSLSNATAATRPSLVRPIRPNSTMKHEWFEKTVRAAARVNSNLSYTLTQLNRAQANATSVEGLAVVHNKLQEILSSSINSLIQIRKNLRTEFIAGIKNLRFPPKPASAPPQPSTSKDDDDVIFVPSDPSPPCPPLVPVSNNTATNKINLPPSISIVKKSQPNTTPSPLKVIPSTSGITIKSTGSASVAKKSTSAPDDSSRPKGFLRVKSFSALQSVPSECITIPDDPVDEEPKKVEEKDPLDVSKDPLDVSEDVSEVVTEDVVKKTVNSHTNGMANGEEKEEDESSNKDGETSLKVTSLDGVGMLKPATIVLQRSQEIDDMVKNKFDTVNGGNVTD